MIPSSTINLSLGSYFFFFANVCKVLQFVQEIGFQIEGGEGEIEADQGGMT